MSRTWKDKRKHELGSTRGAVWRKKRAEQSRRVVALAGEARRQGFNCPACFMLSLIRPDIRCRAHGGDLKSAMQKPLVPEKKKRRILGKLSGAVNSRRTKS
jgi:hypothetical protein